MYIVLFVSIRFVLSCTIYHFRLTHFSLKWNFSRLAPENIIIMTYTWAKPVCLIFIGTSWRRITFKKGKNCHRTFPHYRFVSVNGLKFSTKLSETHVAHHNKKIYLWKQFWSALSWSDSWSETNQKSTVNNGRSIQIRYAWLMTVN
jgi:hypothetical protein